MSAHAYLTEGQSRSLKAKLVDAGLDIGTMAEKMGMSRATLSARINGKTDFTRSEMEAFASVLNARPQDIFFAA
ncbi:MAG: helix-turn-helix transcriptional regulator [Christensenellaceae bacterium]|nr:helix-turn-helix transcriptional regulator [Christensenellaceae bacterium]